MAASFGENLTMCEIARARRLRVVRCCLFGCLTVALATAGGHVAASPPATIGDGPAPATGAALVGAAAQVPPAGAVPQPALDAARQPPGSDWSLRTRHEGLVEFHGVVNFDAAGGSATPFLYPAPNAVGLVAAVIAHAVVAGVAASRQKDRIVAQADLVLTPYRPTLGSLTNAELMEHALQLTHFGERKQVLDIAAQAPDGWTVESAPKFSMTQDQRGLVLDTPIAIFTPDNPKKARYQSVVRVVSQPAEDDDRLAHWTANSGEHLKEETAALFSQALEVALRDAQRGDAGHDAAAPYQTFRYWLGGAEKMERAQLVDADCNRLLIRTLRGWLMSVPVKRGPANPAAKDPHCTRP